LAYQNICTILPASSTPHFLALEAPVDPAAGLLFALDGATCAAASFNTAWLLARWARPGSDRRRTAAAALALLNAGIAVEAAFAQALLTAHRLGASTAPYFATASWLAARGGLLAGTLLVSALILRRREA
jgi:hypothetical protein